MLSEAAAEAGIQLLEEPIVERVRHKNKSGRNVSAIKWGAQSPELVFLHGGAQNAHTWDTLAMALQTKENPQPCLLAIDLPGHGHSDWRDDHDYNPKNLAEDVSDMLEELAPNAKAVVGMSLGGLTSIMLTGTYSHLVPALALVDITPGISREKAEPILEFISGPEIFDSFDAILEYTQKFNPSRSSASLIRGIKNNAKEIEDGKWTWRWDPTRKTNEQNTTGENNTVGEANKTGAFEKAFDVDDIWAALENTKIPTILYKGGSDSSVLDEESIEEFLNRKPDSEVVIVPEAGHSIQGDKPVELAGLITDFVGGSV